MLLTCVILASTMVPVETSWGAPTIWQEHKHHVVDTVSLQRESQLIMRQAEGAP